MSKMLLRRLDDYQSWQVSFAGASVLIDPWLTSEPITGSFDRQHTEGFISQKEIASERGIIAAILLCTSVNDHLRAETLKAMKDVPVHGNSKAAKAARAVGCTSTHAHQVGETFLVDCPEGGTISIAVTKTGLPLGLIAVGFLLEAFDGDHISCGRLWIEPHQPTTATAHVLKQVDVVVFPTQSVLAVVMPVTAGSRKTAKATLASRAHTLVPTSTNPRRDMRLWQKMAYYVTGSNAAVQRGLAASNTQLVALRTGDWLEVKVGR